MIKGVRSLIALEMYPLDLRSEHSMKPVRSVRDHLPEMILQREKSLALQLCDGLELFWSLRKKVRPSKIRANSVKVYFDS